VFPLITYNYRLPIYVSASRAFLSNLTASKNICMAQFFINLPNNRQGNVRTGIKRAEKKSFLQLLMPWKNIDKEEKLAYIVEVTPMYDIQEYRLLKAKNGDWLNDGDDKWLRHGEGNINNDIKNAIDAYEQAKRV